MSEVLENCPPCQGCEPAEPVLPRCDISLIDGTFTNATVVVEDGCITSVTMGEAPQYTPDLCCDPVTSDTGGGSGSSDDCDCEDGENATINIGTVVSIPAGNPPQVTNSGTDTNAVLNFYIPQGQQGSSGDSGTGVNSDAGGIYIENGLITGLPAQWPPVGFITTSYAPSNVDFTATAPDPLTGIVNLDLDLTTFEGDLKQWIYDYVETPLQNQISALQNQMSSLQQQVAALQTSVANCCSGGFP